MSKDGVTDRDCINLSELVYQNLGDLSTRFLLYNIFYDGNKVKPEIKQKFPEYAKSLATFPDYYIPTFKKYTLLEPSGNYSKDYYYGVAFQNKRTNEIVIANRGTVNDFDSVSGTLLSIADLIADFELGMLGKADAQFRDANKFCKHMINYALNKTNNIDYTGIVLTGHSLGGAQAATQFVSFYTPGGILKGMRTYEAPGMKNVFENKNIFGEKDLSSPGTDAAIGLMAKGAIMSGKRAVEYQNEVNNSDQDYKFNNMLHGKYESKHSQLAPVILQYGTNIDWIFNGLPHVGKTINLLGKKGGKFVPIGKLEYVKEKGGLPVDVYHSMSTYKIYALGDDDNIVPEHLNTVNFLKLVIPLMIKLKLDHHEIMDLLKQMYEAGIQSYADVDAFVIKEYKTESTYLFEEYHRRVAFAENNKETMVRLYKYSEYLNRLQAGTDEYGFVMNAEELLRTDFKNAIIFDEKSETQKKFELNSKISHFEMKYHIHNLIEIEDLNNFPPPAFSPSNSDEVDVLFYLFKYKTDHSKTASLGMCWQEAYKRYKAVSENEKYPVSRRQDMFHVMCWLQSKLSHCHH